MIVGGGVIGLSTAVVLAKEGYEVSLFERDNVGAHASSNNAGLVVPSMYNPYPLSLDFIDLIKKIISPKSPVRISIRKMGCSAIKSIFNARQRLKKSGSWRKLRRLGIFAIEYMEELIKEMDIDVEYSKGEILEVYKSRKLFEEAKWYAKEVEIDGLEIELLTKDEILTIEPSLSKNIIGGLRYVYDGSINPRKYIQGLRILAEKYNVDIHENQEVISIETDEAVNVKLNNGEKYRGDYVVIATGPWTSSIISKLGINLPIYPARGYVIDIKVDTYILKHQLMLEEIKVVANPYKEIIRLAGVMDFVGFNPKLPKKRIHGILQDVYTYIPKLLGHRIIEIKSAFRPCTPDEIPIIGPIPKNKKVIIAAGHCRFGLTFSALTSYIIKDYLSEEEMPSDMDIFSPSRFLEQHR